MSECASPTAGFTLLEALIATLLMAIILTMLGAITQAWLPNWNRGFIALQRSGLLAVGLDRLVDDLAAAEIVYAATDLPVFDGTERSVTFVRTTLRPNTFSGLEVVRIAETDDASGRALVRSTTEFVPPITDIRELTFSDPVVLVRTLDRVSFSYAGSDRVWRDSWRGAPQLPRAIRVRLQDAASMKTVSTSTSVHAELSERCAAAMMRLDLVQRRLGVNQGAAATVLIDCSGPAVRSGPGASVAGDPAVQAQ